MRPFNNSPIVKLNAFLVFSALVASATQTRLPPTILNGTSDGQYISTSSGFDGPKITNLNASAYDWWYFDVVSQDYEYSIVAIFFTSPNTSFPFTQSDVLTLEVTIAVQTPENNSYYTNLTYGSGATVTVDGNDISGVWEGTGSSFTGSANMTKYEILFDAQSQETLGFSGSISMNSVAPSHYPCSAPQSGSNMELLPHVGWANAVPDAQTTVNLTIDGKEVSFSGVGYHDKNWGDAPFADTVASWYWGHGRLGPYSIVWFDAIAQNGTEYASGYVTKDGTILGTPCGTNNVKVRPTGVNATYPPHAGSSDPEGFAIEIDLGDDGVFEVHAATDNYVLTLPGDGVYRRWTGALSGGIRGADNASKGTTLFEQFAMLP